MKVFTALVLQLLFCSVVCCQSQLRPGFDSKEYLMLMDVFQHQNDSIPNQAALSSLTGFRHVYQSPEGGLKNRIDVWVRPDNVGIICIRGTVNHPQSWLENFYAAMIPAIGSLHINDTTTFNYQLAADSSANVHVGWTVGLSYLAPLVIKQINELHAKGVKAFLIFGHSQGGALAFLLRSYLQYTNTVPKDIIYKTYCSAAPKPGDLYYAYDIDYITRGGWCLRVVNSMDWVPETPFTVQTLANMNAANPFGNISSMLGNQKWYVRWYINGMFRKMKRAGDKTLKRYQKYLGKKMYAQVKKALPGFQQPLYSGTNNYMTAGTPAILMANSAYRQQFLFTGQNIFVHHLPRSYRFLVHAIYP